MRSDWLYFLRLYEPIPDDWRHNLQAFASLADVKLNIFINMFQKAKHMLAKAY